MHLLSQEIREAPPAHPSAASDIDASPAAPPNTDADADVSGTAEGAVRPASGRTATLIAEEDPRGEAASVFKAGLGCAPAATPVISAAFGGYEHGPARGASAHATGRGGGADCAAPASSRL